MAWWLRAGLGRAGGDEEYKNVRMYQSYLINGDEVNVECSGEGRVGGLENHHLYDSSILQ